jgi:hypothetical protein
VLVGVRIDFRFIYIAKKNIIKKTIKPLVLAPK